MLAALSLGAVTIELQGIEVSVITFTIALIIGIGVFLPLLLLRTWFFYRRRLRKNKITAEFDAPVGLGPAEIAYLFSSSDNDRILGATIIQLIQKGYLHLKRVNEQKVLFAGPRESDTLANYENELIQLIDQTEGVRVPDLMQYLKEQRYSFKTHIKQTLVDKKYIRQHYTKSFLKKLITISLLLMALCVLWPLFFVWFSGTIKSGFNDFTSLWKLLFGGVLISVIFAPVFILLSLLTVRLRGRMTGRDWIATSRLRRSWAQIIGFRQYVKLTEDQKLHFSSAELKKKSEHDTIAYSVALGFVKNWRDIIS